jgi:hypothetical protein
MNTKSNQFSYLSFFVLKTCFEGLGRQKLKRKERVKIFGNGISYFLTGDGWRWMDFTSLIFTTWIVYNHNFKNLLLRTRRELR